ncbi:MAG: DUF86 domain-containing protein [Bacteroidales bacterium]|nr:DUF86 domain-containing protein [Bacteroidales bacterium]
MSKPSNKDFGCLLSILDSINKILDYTKNFETADEFYNNTLSFDATLMNFVVIGEMAEKLSNEFRSATESDIDWYKIKGFRNIIAHIYFGIDAEEVWQIIQDNLLELKEKVLEIMKS